MPRDAVSRTANVGTVGINGLTNFNSSFCQKESDYSYNFSIELGHEKISLLFLFQLNPCKL